MKLTNTSIPPSSVPVASAEAADSQPKYPAASATSDDDENDTTCPACDGDGEHITYSYQFGPDSELCWRCGGTGDLSEYDATQTEPEEE